MGQDWPRLGELGQVVPRDRNVTFDYSTIADPQISRMRVCFISSVWPHCAGHSAPRPVAVPAAVRRSRTHRTNTVEIDILSSQVETLCQGTSG